MSEENNVVNARNRFRGGAESPEQRRQARADGAEALEVLKACKRLSLEDREQIARRIGFYIHTGKVDRTLLAKRAGYEAKDLYRMAINYGDNKYGEKENDKYRLRAAGKGYAAVIDTLAGLLRPPANVVDLADKVTRGTSVHPSDSGASSDAGAIIKLLYGLVDGLDEEFNLTKKFRVISRMKAVLRQRDAWALWPAWLNEDNWKERDRLGDEPREERLQSSFWIVHTEEENEWAIKRLESKAKLANRELTDQEIEQQRIDPTFEFDNWHWEQVIGYLPHFFLGHQRDFAWDGDFWPPPPNLVADSKEERLWADQLEDDIFDVIGRQTMISTKWDDNNHLLFNGDPSDVYRRRIYKFQIMTNAANNPDDWDYDPEDEDIHPYDPPAFHWLCLYPNADASGIVPVLLSTDWNYGEGNTIELLDESMLSNMDHYSVLGGETLGTRLRRAILTQHKSQEPTLKTEWRRTARFVERHPLWRKHQEYEATAKHIREWREQVLKGGPDRSDHQEEES